ncbi:hypothetical protein A3E62_03110 [Candidatus Giovannonibacteria bacterium RIFCSPHIGHO2_12_FULL_44_29]|nr:MAG: hypothetical protein A3E62_03110 [Candidatus Giovannonibacteria bacterium RIFCSPHIGHO2_12_FULL_44_29]
MARKHVKYARKKHGHQKELLKSLNLLSGVYSRAFAYMTKSLIRRIYLIKAIRIQKKLDKYEKEFSPRMLYTRARIFFLAGMHKEALALTNTILAKRDISASLRAISLINAAQCLEKEGEIAEACRHYVDANELAGSVNIETRMRIFRACAEHLSAWGDRVLALNFFERAEKLALSGKGKLLFVEAERIRRLSKELESETGAVREVKT